jgi:GNAT superfamily N-acetyltransferase
VARRVLSHPDARFFTLRRDGEVAAIARSVVSSGWVGVSAVEVKPEHRRQGLAGSVMRAVLTDAASRGAQDVYLQVSDDNGAALRLYGRLGFTTHHRYRYLTPQASSPAQLPPVLDFEPTPYDDPVAQELIATLQAEFVVRYGSPDETPVHPGEFSPPHGVLLIGRLDGQPVACGAWRRADPSAGPAVGEIKRMYVDAAHRGKGFSRQVLAALEQSARAAGLTRLRLETGDRQPEAIGLYQNSGWSRIPGFGYYADAPGSVCFGKEL